MKNESSIICGVCGSESVKLRRRLNVSGYVAYSCSVCGCQFSMPTPSQADLISAYQSFDAGEISRLYFDRYTQASTKMILSDFKRASIEEYSGLRFLDYGCGGGHILRAVKDLGAIAIGCEIDTESAKQGEIRGLDILNCDFRGFPDDFYEEKFDFIIVNHVLEHIVEPGELFACLIGCLKPGGVLSVRVPDQASFPSRLKKLLCLFGVKAAEWGFVQPPIHLFGFTLDTFRYLATHNRLEILRLDKVSPLVEEEFPTVKEYWQDLPTQKIVYWMGRLFGSGGNLAFMARKLD